MSESPISHLGRTPADRHTVLRPFEVQLRSTFNRQNLREAQAGNQLGAVDLIAGGGYRIVREITLAPGGRDAGGDPGDLIIAHDTGEVVLVGPAGPTRFTDSLAVLLDLTTGPLDPGTIYTATFGTRAITPLAGILAEESQAEALEVLHALRTGRGFAMRARHVNRVLIQAIEAAGSINHLVEGGQREAWMSLRFNDVVSSLTLS